jgi:hypothetical protein
MLLPRLDFARVYRKLVAKDSRVMFCLADAAMPIKGIPKRGAAMLRSGT